MSFLKKLEPMSQKFTPPTYSCPFELRFNQPTRPPSRDDVLCEWLPIVLSCVSESKRRKDISLWEYPCEKCIFRWTIVTRSQCFIKVECTKFRFKIISPFLSSHLYLIKTIIKAGWFCTVHLDFYSIQWNDSVVNRYSIRFFPVNKSFHTTCVTVFYLQI